MDRNGGKKGAQPPHLFAEWERVAERIHKARRVLLFLDFDGTLVGFKRNPEEVRLEASTRWLLERLARYPRITLIFISGRRRADLRRRVGVRGANYIGLHGFERRPGVRLSAFSRRCLSRLCRLIAESIRGLAGVWLEDKGGSIVLHYRGASAAAGKKARNAVRNILKAEGISLRILRGKKIWELLAPEIKGKGAAASEIVRDSGAGVLPVYFGDDATDETAFASLRGAVTVHVGNGSRTLAHYRVSNVEEVKAFLERLDSTVA